MEPASIRAGASLGSFQAWRRWRIHYPLVTRSAGMILLSWIAAILTSASQVTTSCRCCPDLRRRRWVGLSLLAAGRSHPLVPLAFAITVPAETISGRIDWPWLLVAVGFTVVAFVVARLVWLWGIRNYSGASA